MTNENRVPTGVPGLDEILHGGLIPNRIYLIVGSAGSGKTVLSFIPVAKGGAASG